MHALRSLSLAGLLLLASAHAQDQHVLTGQVVDEHDNSKLELAEVLVLGTAAHAFTDEQGAFRIEGLRAGRYVVRVAHIGCDPVEVEVELPLAKPLVIHLEHHAKELHDVEVARKRPDENVGQARGELNKAAMEGSSGRSLSEMLATISGVNVLNSGPTITKPVIHGLSGNRVLILNQGIRQEDQQWGTEHAPNLDPFSTDRITVVKGAASVQYGSDALGGVVITEPVELPRSAGVQGEVRGVGLLNGRGGGGHVLLQGGVKGLRGIGWRVQGSGRVLGDSEAPAYVLSNTGMQEQGASASVGFRDHRTNAAVYYSWFARELGILRASHVGNLTDLNNAIASGEPWYTSDFTYTIGAPRQTVQHHLLKAEAGHAVSERDRIVLTYGYQADDRQEYDVRRAGRSDVPSVDLFLVTHTGDAVLKHWIGKRMHGNFGVNGVLQKNLNIPGTGVRPLIPNYEKQSGGVFVLEHWPFSERLEMEMGARLESTRLNVAKYDRNDLLIEPEHRFVNHAFSAGANWSVNDSLRLRLDLGTGFRPPHVSELYSEGLHHGAAAIEQGDDRLGSERSWKATTDIEAIWCKGRLTTNATVYLDRINGFIYLRPEGVMLTVRGAFPVFQYVATEALIHGLDADLRYRLDSTWSVRSRVSLVRGSDLTQNEHLFQMPGDRFTNSLEFEPKGQGAWNTISVAFTSTLVLQQTRVPVDVDLMAAPGTYHLIGLQASITRRLHQGELRFGVQGNNLFNTAYRDYLDRFRYYADARGRDITIWVRYSFGKEK